MFDYGKRISDLRKKNGISANKLAISLEVSPSQISRIESGINFPSMQLFDKIINYFGISYSDFFNDESSFIEVSLISENRTEYTPGKTNAKITTDEMDMIVAYRKASEAERTAINALLGQYKSSDDLGSKYA